jgi:hypothetical protein|tara:strand:- start:644 stop:766 length:123 start_codon:yes stop_codon:yes gene_type:complete
MKPIKHRTAGKIVKKKKKKKLSSEDRKKNLGRWSVERRLL